MRKILFIIFLTFPNFAWATDHYFDNGAPDNTLPCTLADPCDNFPGTTLDGVNAVAAGDTINFNRGDEWCGTEAAWMLDSTGTSSNPIYVQAYGAGNDPKFWGSCAYGGTWTNLTGNIWYTTGQTQSRIYTVTTGDNKALFRWSGNNNNLPAGSFCRTTSATAGTACTAGSTNNGTGGSVLMVNLWDGSNPNSTTMRIGSITPADVNRGIIRGSTNSARGDYVYWRDLDINGMNGIGFTMSAPNNQTANLDFMGNGRDGAIAMMYEPNGETCENCRMYTSEVSYNAANGSPNGQGITWYSPQGALIDIYSHHNAMAGIDLLDYNNTVNCQNIVMKYIRTNNNGLWPTVTAGQASYDPNIYIDGCSEVFAIGMEGSQSGVGTGPFGGSNARAAIRIGSENPPTDPAENIWIVDSLFYGSHWEASDINNTVANQVTKNITYSNVTFAGYAAGSFEMTFGFDTNDISTTAHQIDVFNSIFLASNSAPVYIYIPSSASTIDFLELDYNQYYRRGGKTMIWGQGGSACNSDTSTCYSLSEWQTYTGEDANSDYGDPLLTTDSDTAMDSRLRAGSPAIDSGTDSPYTPPSFLDTYFSDLFPDSASKMPGGYSDDTGNKDTGTLDKGRHIRYGIITNSNIEPESLVQSATGSVTATFNLSDMVLLRNGKIKITFPSGFVLDSGGSTAVSALTGISGTATASVSGQVVTITRTGDGNTEFPGTFSFTLSNIQNPSSTGSTGNYSIRTYDSSDRLMSEETTVDEDIITTAASSPSIQFTCSGTINMNGVTFR